MDVSVDDRLAMDVDVDPVPEADKLFFFRSPKKCFCLLPGVSVMI
jgi:hypothetical protein